MKRYDHKATVEAYMESRTAKIAAKRLRITPSTLSMRLAAMRKAGVNIPKYRTKSFLPAEIKELDELVNSYRVKEGS